MTIPALLRVASFLGLWAGVVLAQPGVIPGSLPPSRTGLMYISGSSSNSIGEYHPDGTFIRTITVPGLTTPRGIAVDGFGNLMVVTQTGAAVRRIALDGTVLNTYTFPVLTNGTGIAARNSTWFVGNFSPGRIVMFSDSSPNPVATTITQPGMDGVNCVAFDANGDFAVTAAITNQVHRFNASGGWLGVVTHPTLASPMSIALDSQGNHYVSNGATALVSKFDPNWVFLSSFGTGVLNGPQGIAIDELDRLTITNFYTPGVARYSTSGVLLDAWPLTGVNLGRNLAFQNAPFALARDGSVNLGADVLARPLTLNAQTGGPLATINLAANQPATLSLAAAPTSTGGAPFALYVYPGTSGATVVSDLPFGLGPFAFPTTFTALTSTLAIPLVNSLGAEAILGTGFLPALTAPTTVLDFPSGIGITATLTLQALLIDPAARNPANIPLSATNALTLNIL